jgi:dolichol-phosphate mannosyltransferase
MDKMKKKSLAIIVSVYNEEGGLLNFSKILKEELEKIDVNSTVVYVNDGSTDKSKTILDSIVCDNNNVKCIHFSKNFGHEAAMLAGIDNTDADAIICLDSDLQHPPSMIAKMYETHLQGYDLISMIRLENLDSTVLKKFTSKMFYKTINKISSVNLEENASDFFLISKKISNLLKNDFRERNRFIRGFIQIVGFRRTTMDYIAGARRYGKSKYSTLKLVKLSIKAVVAFSKLPLIMGVIVGMVFAAFSIVIGIYSFLMYFIGSTPPGYTTLIVFLSSVFSIQFFLIGIIGIYIGFNFEETKKRPIYIIDYISDYPGN